MGSVKPFLVDSVQFLMDFFKQLPTETQIFLFIIACLWAFFHAKFTDKAAHNGPTILTTIGIFATFVGIALALWQAIITLT